MIDFSIQALQAGKIVGLLGKCYVWSVGKFKTRTALHAGCVIFYAGYPDGIRFAEIK